MEALASIAARSLVALGTSLVTEKFVMKISILVLEYLAKSTKNDLDDKVVAAVKESLAKEKK